MSSKFLSLEWFISKIKKSRKIEQEVEKQKPEKLVMKVYVKPYMSLKLVNNVITIVLTDGSVISKSEVSLEQFENVKNSTSLNELLSSLKEKKFVEETKQIQEVVDAIEFLAKLNDFELKDNSLIFKETSRTIPKLLINKFYKIAISYPNSEDLNNNIEYQSLKNFFMWCCLNPRAEVADKLYDFLEQNSFRITKQGFFVALRNVVTISTETDKELVIFISNSYNKVKAIWKQTPSKYFVFQKEDNTYYFTKKEKSSKRNKFIGNLQKLYLNLPNMKENRYTDNYTKTFDIRIGKVVNMLMKDCSWSTSDCAREGLHFCSNEINYVGCGDTSVLVLINPMKVVGIGTSKGRCYEYLPIMIVNREEATTILHDNNFNTLELDEDYTIHELEELENKVKQGFVSETSKHEFNLPNISNIEIRKIVLNLNKLKEQISNRIVKLD